MTDATCNTCDRPMGYAAPSDTCAPCEIVGFGENLFTETDEVIIEAAMLAFEGHPDFPERMPRCEEENGSVCAALANFFEAWLTDTVADFYEDGFTAEDDARAVDLAFDFECAVFECAAFESVAWAIDIQRTNAGLPR